MSSPDTFARAPLLGWETTRAFEHYQWEIAAAESEGTDGLGIAIEAFDRVERR